MNLKYRKKPVEITAWQFTKENYRDGVPNEFKLHSIALWSRYGGNVIGGEIATLEGVMSVQENDFIILGIKGEPYTCKPYIFFATYEAVT